MIQHEIMLNNGDEILVKENDDLTYYGDHITVRFQRDVVKEDLTYEKKVISISLPYTSVAYIEEVRCEKK